MRHYYLCVSCFQLYSTTQCRGYLANRSSRAMKCAAKVRELVLSRWKHKLLVLDVWYLRGRMVDFAKAIFHAGSPLPNVWGFVDGSVRYCHRNYVSRCIILTLVSTVCGVSFAGPQFFPTARPGGFFAQQRNMYSGEEKGQERGHEERQLAYTHLFSRSHSITSGHKRCHGYAYQGNS